MANSKAKMKWKDRCLFWTTGNRTQQRKLYLYGQNEMLPGRQSRLLLWYVTVAIWYRLTVTTDVWKMFVSAMYYPLWYKLVPVANLRKYFLLLVTLNEKNGCIVHSKSSVASPRRSATYEVMSTIAEAQIETLYPDQTLCLTSTPYSLLYVICGYWYCVSHVQLVGVFETSCLPVILWCAEKKRRVVNLYCTAFLMRFQGKV
jgi:hypothetical protein